MPVFYNFTQDGLVYSFDDIFIPADLFREGNLWAWGSGSGGRLGNGATTGSISTPVTTFAGGTNWKQVSISGNRISGSRFAAAIKTDGTLWVWGSGSDGRLGNGTTTGSISTPVTTFAGETNWKQVSCGASSSGAVAAAIKTDGTLWLWGLNSSGQLGNASITSVSTPVTTFAGGTNWKQVSCGGDHITAIKTDGTLWVWGSTFDGRLGNGATTGSISTPVTTFAGGTNWKQVSASTSFHTAAIKTDGTLWTWGRNHGTSTFLAGALGNNDTTNISISTPITTFAGGTNWKQVSCGANHTAAIKTDGTLWLWGGNHNQQLGNNITTTTPSLTPITTFAGGTNWKEVSCGGSTFSQFIPANWTFNGLTGAIKTDGTLWTWGRNSVGGLGTNDTTQRNTPVTTFAGGTNWKQVSAGYTDMSALTYDDPVI